MLPFVKDIAARIVEAGRHRDFHGQSSVSHAPFANPALLNIGALRREDRSWPIRRFFSLNVPV
jgi:hypothetical protein